MLNLTQPQPHFQIDFICQKYSLKVSNPNFCESYQKKHSLIMADVHPCKGCGMFKAPTESLAPWYMRMGGRRTGWHNNDAVFVVSQDKPKNVKVAVPWHAHKAGMGYCKAGKHWADKRNFNGRTCLECVRKRRSK
jgi:hypothetical protein